MKNTAGRRVKTNAPPKISGIDSRTNIEELKTKKFGRLLRTPSTPRADPRRIPPWMIANHVNISGIV